MSGNENYFHKRFIKQTVMNQGNPVAHGSNITAIPANDKILLFSQLPHLPQYPGGHQNSKLLGAPLIPFLAEEKQISATEKNSKIIEEVKREKEKVEINTKSINEIYSKGKDLGKNMKCDLHPKQLSEKCRKCKEIRSEITKKMEEKNNSIKKEVKNVDKDNQKENKEEIVSIKDPVFKIHCDHISCNLNSLLLNNILSSQYFKDEIAVKSFQEVIQEIVENVTYAEPWAVGMAGIPSTLFCCLYKLMLSKLTESQVKFLVENKMNVYLRCAGLLYIRFLADPKDLWNLLSPYLDDDEVFSVTADKKVISVGEYVENLLKDYDYYGTRLPRIPMTIEREIKAKLILREECKRGVDKWEKAKVVNKSRSRSSSRDRRRKKHSRKYSSDSSSSRSRSRRKHRKHRRESRSKSRSRSKSSDKELIRRIKEREKEAVVAKGRDYAAKPSSFKSALSTKLPGNIKKRSKSPSPLNHNIQYVITREPELPGKNKIEKFEYSKEYLERQAMLRKQYGDTSTQKKSLKTDNQIKNSDGDYVGPDIMKLG